MWLINNIRLYWITGDVDVQSQVFFIFTCVCMCIYTCVYKHWCGGLQLASGVFVASHWILLRHIHLLNISASLTSQSYLSGTRSLLPESFPQSYGHSYKRKAKEIWPRQKCDLLIVWLGPVKPTSGLLPLGLKEYTPAASNHQACSNLLQYHRKQIPALLTYFWLFFV